MLNELEQDLKIINERLCNTIASSVEYQQFLEELPASISNPDTLANLHFPVIGYLHLAPSMPVISVELKDSLNGLVADVDAFMVRISNQQHGQCVMNDRVYDLLFQNVDLREYFMALHLLSQFNKNIQGLRHWLETWNLDYLLSDFYQES